MTTKFQLAKGRIALHCGFMLPLLSKLKWIPTDKVAVAATNGVYGWYNEEHFEKERTLGEVIFIILHEIGHCMLCHMSRLGGRDGDLANIAMDFALDPRIKVMMDQTPTLKAEIPKDAHIDPKWGDANWEWIYDQLLKDQPPPPPNGGCGGMPGKGGKGSGKNQLKLFDEVLKPGDKPDGVEEGEGAEDGGQPGQGGYGHGMSEDELKELDKSWLLAAQAAASMAKSRGIHAGLLEEFINDMIKPNIDWQTQLQDLLSRVAKDESSWRRFNRRHLHRESYLPGMYNEKVGPIAFMLDTSGSISRPECAAALGSINVILEDCAPEKIYFGQCDTRMRGEVEELTVQDLPLTAFNAKGRGGTDLNPIFEWAVEHEDDIDALIVQTDGEISAIEAENIPHRVPVIWVVTTDHTMHCTFGHVIQVKL